MRGEARIARSVLAYPRLSHPCSESCDATKRQARSDPKHRRGGLAFRRNRRRRRFELRLASVRGGECLTRRCSSLSSHTRARVEQLPGSGVRASGRGTRAARCRLHRWTSRRRRGHADRELAGCAKDSRRLVIRFDPSDWRPLYFLLPLELGRQRFQQARPVSAIAPDARVHCGCPDLQSQVPKRTFPGVAVAFMCSAH